MYVCIIYIYNEWYAFRMKHNLWFELLKFLSILRLLTYILASNFFLGLSNALNFILTKILSESKSKYMLKKEHYIENMVLKGNIWREDDIITLWKDLMVVGEICLDA